MNKIKLFYSYSRKDSKYRDQLETHLAILKNKGLIDEWHDRDICPGDDWNEEIEKNMVDSHIILLLFSPDFIASEPCQKEVEMAMKLKKEKNVILIPIILRDCSWKDYGDIPSMQALPDDGEPIKKWDDEDVAWRKVYEGIKEQVEKMRDKITSKLKDKFKNELLSNPSGDDRLDELFVYPDILEITKSKQNLEHNEIDSIKLKDIKSFKDKYVLIEGEEQSGKTSLCNMLYLYYVNEGFYPILVNGESIAGKADMSRTSYGHCYHAMITTQLFRAKIKLDSMDQYFNFLTELSYFMFKKNKKNIYEDELNQFSKEYDDKYIFDKRIIGDLMQASILKNKSATCSFQYVYIYYYFVAKYISDHIDDKDVKEQVNKLMSSIHKKDNSNIVIFITHHTKNNELLDDILLHTMVTFDDFPEAHLEKSETKFIGEAIEKLKPLRAISENNNVEEQRKSVLKKKDELQPTNKNVEDDRERKVDDSLSIEIRRSAKSMEIIGQIIKNQCGTFSKDKLSELFKNGQNVGLRLLKSFIDLMNDDPKGLADFIKEKVLQRAEEKNQKLSDEEAMLISQQYITQFSYSIIFGWLHKIVDSLGYGRIVDIADDVNDKTNTPASKLINLSIHAWYTKELDIAKLKNLYKEFDNDNNHTANYILKDIVSRHIYMHKIYYKDKQKIDSLLGFSVQKQVEAQRKIK